MAKRSAPAIMGSKMLAPSFLGGSTYNYTPPRYPAPVKSPTPVLQPSSAHSGVHSAAGTGFPGMSDDEVAAMLGMEYTGDRDQDQMVQDAVEQARTENAIATGTYPSQAEIDQRTASFEATMEQLRNDPAMREAWGIDRDTRQFDVGTILRIAAAFAIPAISGAIVNALNLSGTVANITQATLEAAFSSATGGSPAGSLISSFGGALGDVADAVETADQAGGLIETVEGLVDFIQQVDEYGRRPEDAIEAVTGEDLRDTQPAGEVEVQARTTIEEAEEEEELSYQDRVRAAAEAGAEADVSGPKTPTLQEEEESGYLDYLQQVADASVGLEPDADLMGTKDITGDLGESRGIETYFLDALELADFNAGNDVVLSDGTVINNRTHEMTGTPGFGGGQLVTERDVVVEDEGGGGAEAVPQPQPETTTTTDAGAGDTALSDEPSTGLEIGDGTDQLIDQLEEAIEAETDDATREDLENVLEDLQETQAEEPEEAVEQPEPDVFDPAETVTETTETEEAGADEDDDDGLLFIPGLPEDETVVDTPDDVVVTEVDEVVAETDDLLDSEVEVPAETTEISDTPDEGQAPGDGQEGTGETGTGGEGVGDDGTGEGEGGEGDGGGESQPQRKRFTPAPTQTGLLTGSIPYQDIPFVGVPYEQKDYMMELNSLINRSLFGDMIK
jgi:hypothetical protein